MDDILAYVYNMIWKFSMLLIITWTGMYFVLSTDLSEVTKAYAEISATSGGFTTALYDDLRDELRGIGLDPNKTVINIKATTPGGIDISNKAINVTVPDITPYPSEPVYLPRGTKVSLEIYTTEKSPLTTALNFVGITSDLKKGYSRKVYMSERVE